MKLTDPKDPYTSVTIELACVALDSVLGEGWDSEEEAQEEHSFHVDGCVFCRLRRLHHSNGYIVAKAQLALKPARGAARLAPAEVGA